MRNKTVLTLASVGYLACIVAANWALNRWGLIGFLGMTVPAGTFFAGLSFGMRDAVQEAGGRLFVVGIILVGTLLSWFIEPTFAFASGTAFLFGELADFAVYTPLRERQWATAVVASNIVGSVVDSLLFLWLAFDSVAGWVDLTVVKALMIVPALVIVGAIRTSRALTVA